MTLPRLLHGFQTDGGSYERHLQLHRELPSTTGPGAAFIAELTMAGLRGRGGGRFPLGEKLDAVRRSRGKPVVVVNGCEGEPMSFKDRVLLESLPHLVLDGALCCARALQATELLIAVDETRTRTTEAVERALAERGDIEATVVDVPTGYVTGQETAVVNLINGGPAIPRHVPPRVTQRGVSGRPTLVSNPETLAHAALIARYGSDWFREGGHA